MVALSASQSRAAEFNEGLQHSLQIKRRAADDLEHVGGCGLLLQRFAQLVEQPRVLDGDDGLVGKVSTSSICFSVNGRTLGAMNVITPNRVPSRNSGTAQRGANLAELLRFAERVLRVGKQSTMWTVWPSSCRAADGCPAARPDTDELSMKRR